MSESDKSLEDFFAKKSKKKGAKGKGKKFTTSDEIAKKLVEQPAQEAPEKTEAATKKPKETPKTKDEKEEENVDYRFKDDDEWTDFRDESQKDYSGLKVQALQITEEQPEVEEEEEIDENGDIIKSKGQAQSGPWNKKQDSSAPVQAQAKAPVAPAPVPEPPKEEPKPAASDAPAKAKYVPPGRRGAAADSGSSTPSSKPAPGAWRKGKAPSINSEFDFPSLAASSDLVKHSNKVEDATFSTVTRGGQAVDGSAAKGGNLALGNRFSALEN